MQTTHKLYLIFFSWRFSGMFKCQSQKLTSGMLSYIFCYPSEIYFRITILPIMEINNSLLPVQRTMLTDCNCQTSENI